MDALQLIKSRRSVRAFKPDPVPREVIERILDAAVWAPNHKLTEPWRFYVMGSETKRRFAELRSRLRAGKVADPNAPEVKAAVERIYNETLATPVLLAVALLVAGDQVQRDEDFAATAMAVQNILLGAAGLGVGTYLRTGEIIQRPEMRELLGLPGNERIFGVIYMGYPAEVAPKRRAPYTEKTRWLD